MSDKGAKLAADGRIRMEKKAATATSVQNTRGKETAAIIKKRKKGK